MMIEVSGSTPTDRSEVSDPPENPRGLKIPVRVATLAAAALLAVGLAACGPGDEGDNDANQANQNQANDGEHAEVELDGAFNKGPFVLGSSVDVSPTDDEANPVGETFSTETDNHLGEFSLNFSYEGLARIEGNGFYYNEATGELSDAALTLRALEDIQEGGDVDAFVNIITHLSYQRIVSLLEDGTDFEEAVDQAEDEIQTAMALEHVELDDETSGTDMNIVGDDSTEYAYLFAVSSILAWATDGEDSELQSVVNNAASQMEMNGEISDDLADRLEKAQRELPIPYIEDLFEDRLAEIGADDEPVPSLEEVVDSSGDGHANAEDGCPHLYTPDQTDSNDSGIPDACDCGDHRCFEPIVEEFEAPHQEMFVGELWPRATLRDFTGDGELDLLIAPKGIDSGFDSHWGLLPGEADNFGDLVEFERVGPEFATFAGTISSDETDEVDVLVHDDGELLRVDVDEDGFGTFETLATLEETDSSLTCDPEDTDCPEGYQCDEEEWECVPEDDSEVGPEDFHVLERPMPADLTDDGAQEIAVYEPETSMGLIGVLVADEDGSYSFQDDSVRDIDGIPVVLEDFTEDGVLDLGVSDPDEQEFAVYPGNGDGTFSDPIVHQGNRGSGAVGDFTDNGHLDVVGMDCELLEGDGTGQFESVDVPNCESDDWNVTIDAPGVPLGDVSPEVVDVSGDGEPELLAGVEYPGNDWEPLSEVEVYHSKEGQLESHSYGLDPDNDPRREYMGVYLSGGDVTDNGNDDVVLLAERRDAEFGEEFDDGGQQPVETEPVVIVLPGGSPPPAAEQ